MAKKSKRKQSVISDLQRHLLTGAAFGLYFGWFFRPQREPNFIFALLLAVVITLGVFLFRLIRQGTGESRALLQATPMNFVQSFLILASLEARHFFYDFGSGLMSNPVLGGRIATAIVMVLLWAIFGGFYYWRNNQK